MMTKAGNPIQSIKTLVMLNSVLVLFISFVLFYNQSNNANQTQVSQTVAMNTMTAEAMPISESTEANSPVVASDNATLAGLKYVSHNDLKHAQLANTQLANVQAVRYQQQPRVKARSSR